ncbi:MAG: DcuS/MalK family sensor histidine kinase [Tuberibacillus sp.]
MKIGKRYIRLHNFIAFYICGAVILSLIATGLLFGKYEQSETEHSLSTKAMDVAQMISRSPTVIEALEGKEESSMIQSVTQKMQRATGVAFIVVMDMNHIRYSHPNENEIGKRFVGGDEDRAMRGKEYISVAKGTLGKSLRAFAPIYNDQGKQIGVVAVGIMFHSIQDAVAHNKKMIYIGVGVGLLIGILSAIIIARKIKDVLFGLEPMEISRMWQEREAMLRAVKEGILGINQDSEIVFANAEALRLFHHAGIRENPVGKKVHELLPNFHLNDILSGGQARYDYELKIGELTLVTNQVPFTIHDDEVGAVATFRDKTEIKKLAEQLTGVKLYAESLRAQTHEFMNHLHVILGLVHIGDTEEISDYIERMTRRYKIEIGSISDHVKDPIIAGFLLSKLSSAREKGIQFHIAGDGALPSPKNKELVDDAISVIGNLIDNAMEAVEDVPVKNISVSIDYNNETAKLTFIDSGRGIPDNIKSQIFAQGFSTKGQNRGYGLYIVKQCVTEWNGELCLESDREGSTFIVKLPWK